jgi:hypothetical protein
MGWIDKICSHMNRYKKWTPKLVADEAIKYSTRGDFAINAPTAYAYASLNKLLEKVCRHMKPAQIKWTKEMVRKEALKYLSHKDFRQLATKAYEAAKNNGWFDEVCSHLKFAYKKGLPKEK